MTSSTYVKSTLVHIKIVTKISTVPAELALIVLACTAATAKCVPIKLALKTYLEDIFPNVDDLQVAVRSARPQVGTECLEWYSSFNSRENVLRVFKVKKCVTCL
jgi:hypothetical protein